jgi:MoaA/NifB/PqqE/SkfB family radical SAM enzyme
LENNNFSVLYFTGGEPGLYPHLPEAVAYAKKRGMVTSLTSNGTISQDYLRQMRNSLDVLSVSIDHYDERLWAETKHIPSISDTVKDTIRTARACGMGIYGVTFLNPAWSVEDIERVVRYVNGELGIPFALSYPYISSRESTFVVGGKLDLQLQAQRHVRDMVAKVLQMKLQGFEVATVSGYLNDVLRAHNGLPMKYPCKAGENVFTIDCNLDVFPCFKRRKLFNLKERQDFKVPACDNALCDNKYCLINCFKEASVASKKTFLDAIKEELFSNPKFYLKLISKNLKI